jgi:hypothetical protein
VNKPLPRLPGCNPITATEQAARAVKCDLPVPKKLADKPTVYTGDVPPAGTALLARCVRRLLSLPSELTFSHELRRSTTFTTSAYGYKYLGCYPDSLTLRTFPKQLSLPAGKATLASCLVAAKKGGWQYAAMEYGRECWVSKSAPKTGRVEDGRCGMPCVDWEGSYCGGSQVRFLFFAFVSFPLFFRFLSVRGLGTDEGRLTSRLCWCTS